MAKDKHIVTTFGRVNPPTVGHQKLFDKVKSLADSQGAEHDIRVSHSQDSKKNPLSQDQKLSHLRTMFPDHKFSGSSKEHPSFIHHLKDLHSKGYTHVTMVAGSDRVPEYQKIVDKYNKPDGDFHFKSIKIVSAGHRDPDAEGAEGMSASKMRQHAQDGNYHSFKSGLPSHVSHEHAKRLYNDVRKGMGLHQEEHVFMKFKRWFTESAPTNVSAGYGVRGLGDVTGKPAGDISNYAAANAIENADTPKDLLKQHASLHHKKVAD